MKLKKIMYIIAMVVIIAVIIIVVIVNKQSSDNSLISKNNEVNYIENAYGSKENISNEVKRNKKVKEIEINNTNIVYINGTSTLTAEVINTSKKDINVNLKVSVIVNSLNKRVEKEINFGNIIGQSSQIIDLNFNEDLSNADSVQYELIK